MEATGSPQSEGSGYADVLVQVTLPIILFLELVLFIMSQNYKASVEDWEKFKRKDIFHEYDKVLIDLQKQKFIVSLMKIREREQRNILLLYYADHPELLRPDATFKRLCDQSYQIFENLYKREAVSKKLYEEIRDANGLVDPPLSDEHFMDREKVITRENKRYVTEQIDEFLGKVESQVKELQLHIVIQLVEARVAQPPSELSAREQQLIDQLRGAQAAGEDAQPYLTALVTLYVDKLQDQLVRDGYQFLPRTWEVLKALK
jgi:hypothetical protein